MKSNSGTGLTDAASLYSGPQGDLFAIILGQQLHVGGMNASLDLAERAGIKEGLHGADLCCGNGATMRLLVRFRNTASMVGVDATARNIERGQRLCREEGLNDRIRFVLGDACASDLPSASVDFVWGEDAWCYVADKSKLIGEAARIVRPGGAIAFTDWVEGSTGLSDTEAQRFLSIMSFPNVEDIAGYVRLLSDNGCQTQVSGDTGGLPAFFDRSVDMIATQFTYDVLATVGFRTELLKTMTDNLRFLGELAHANKIVQARFVGRRPLR